MAFHWTAASHLTVPRTASRRQNRPRSRQPWREREQKSPKHRRTDGTAFALPLVVHRSALDVCKYGRKERETLLAESTVPHLPPPARRESCMRALCCCPLPSVTFLCRSRGPRLAGRSPVSPPPCRARRCRWRKFRTHPVGRREKRGGDRFTPGQCNCRQGPINGGSRVGTPSPARLQRHCIASSGALRRLPQTAPAAGRFSSV